MKIIIFSGAGISADSGIQTFRDSDGLWENHKVEQVADITSWKSNYNLVHNFYNERRKGIVAAQPNEAHKAIAEWQKKLPIVNLTQNIDDLFEKAGCTDVVHLHGFIHEMKCMACGDVFDHVGDWDVTLHRCKCGCRKAVKPNVVFFGEQAPNYRTLYKTIKEMTPDDIWITIGTSHQVIPIHIYLEQGKKYFVNKEPTIYDEFYDEVYHGNAKDAVPKLGERLWK